LFSLKINDGVSQARKLLLVAPSLKKNGTSLSDKITFLDVHMTLALTEVRSSIPKLLGQAYALNGDTDDVAYVSFTTLSNYTFYDIDFL